MIFGYGGSSNEGDLFHYMMNHTWHTVGLQEALTGLSPMSSMLDVTKEIRGRKQFSSV